MIMETIPPTLRQTTISATMSTRMTAISVITTTYTRLPEQEMAQGTSGGTIQNNNVGVHKNENAGVHQHSSMHSPQSGNNDPQNDPTIKTENMIDVTGNENESKNEDGNDAENDDGNEHEDPDEGKNEQEDLEEAPTNNNNEMDPDTM